VEVALAACSRIWKLSEWSTLLKIFFTAEEVAKKLSTLEDVLCGEDVLRLAEAGRLPVCFRFTGYVGAFKKVGQPLPLVHGLASRHIYLSHGSYLRTRSGVQLNNHIEITSFKEKSTEVTTRCEHVLYPKSVDVAVNTQSAALDGVERLLGEELWIARQWGAKKEWVRHVSFSVPAKNWLFHADDIRPLMRKQGSDPISVRRQAERFQMCVDAGLKMPTDTFAHLPRGIGKIAATLGIKRQSFAEDVKAHLERMYEGKEIGK
jgi:hypothetical protein